MTPTIEQIEEQIATLQQTLEKLKNPKLEVSRNFTGQYFAPYRGILYRRMESESVPIWEFYLDTKQEWTLVTSQDLRELEEKYQKDCVTNTQETLEEFMV
jgi:hypothetical protein